MTKPTALKLPCKTTVELTRNTAGYLYIVVSGPGCVALGDDAKGERHGLTKVTFAVEPDSLIPLANWLEQVRGLSWVSST